MMMRNNLAVGRMAYVPAIILPVVLIVNSKEISFRVEFQLQAIVQLHFITAVLFVDFDNGGVGVIGLHILGNGGRNDSGRNTSGASHLFPIALKSEFHFGTVGKIDFIVVIHRGGKKFHATEMFGNELLRFLW